MKIFTLDKGDGYAMIWTEDEKLMLVDKKILDLNPPNL